MVHDVPRGSLGTKRTPSHQVTDLVTVQEMDVYNISAVGILSKLGQ